MHFGYIVGAFSLIAEDSDIFFSNLFSFLVISESAASFFSKFCQLTKIEVA